MPDDDDQAPDWFQAMDTIIHARPSQLADTNPHRSLDWWAGHESGWDEGVRRVVAKLAAELAHAGLTPSERTPILLRVIEGAAHVEPDLT